MIDDVPKTCPVLATFAPNLAFKLNATPKQRKAYASYAKLRNYHERSGHPIKLMCPIVVSSELKALRQRIAELEGQLLRQVWMKLDEWKAKQEPKP